MAPPYRMGKGPIASAMETYLRVPENMDMLQSEIADGREPADSDFVHRLLALDAALAEAKDPGRGPSAKPQSEHLLADVYGPSDVDPTGPQRQAMYIEAMGQVIDFVKRNGRDDWTIEVLWGCGHPQNQAWISTTKNSSRPGGHVTLVCLSSLIATSFDDSMDSLARPPVVTTSDMVVLHGAADGVASRWYRPPSWMGAAQGTALAKIEELFGVPPKVD
jgi:hypothetical protein